MYLEGKSFKQIGVLVSVPWPSVHWNVKRLGTPMRNVGRRDNPTSIPRDQLPGYDKYAASVRESNLRHSYGINLADYEAMLQGQDGVCAICHKAPKGTRNGKVLHVDHDHNSGKLRQLLCTNCNTGLGKFMDDPELLKLAAIYLESHGK